jgi:hypothetical protein
MISLLFAAAIVAAASAPAKPTPTLRRLDAVTLQQGDGPVVVSIRSTAGPLKESSESLDRFSARILPADATTAPWEPCTTASGAFCQYAPAADGVRRLRFERVQAAGELQIRYTYEGAAESNVIRIPIAPLPATSTLQAIGRAFGAPAPPSAPPAADALRVELGLPAAPRNPYENVVVTCGKAPLYADTRRTPLRAGNAVLSAKAGQTFSVLRTSADDGRLRAIDLGASVYVDASCLKPT